MFGNVGTFITDIYRCNAVIATQNLTKLQLYDVHQYVCHF